MTTPALIAEVITLESVAASVERRRRSLPSDRISMEVCDCPVSALMTAKETHMTSFCPAPVRWNSLSNPTISGEGRGDVAPPS
jgi:hypothetical protein